MEYQRFGDRYQVRLESGDKVVASLTGLAEREALGYAVLSGLGAVRFVTLAYFNVDTKEYETHDIEEQLEATAIVGNITLKEEKPFVHMHAMFGRRDLSTIGGHVMEAVAHSTVEVWLSRENASVRRVHDDESGLSLMDLPEHL